LSKAINHISRRQREKRAEKLSGDSSFKESRNVISLIAHEDEPRSAVFANG